MGYMLHYAPDNASLVVRLVLEELGTGYETVLIDRKSREQDGAAFRALNPAGLIPVLETSHGPMSETAAIILWLADSHGALAPDPQDPARPEFLKWLFFLSNTLHARLRLLFYAHSYVGEDPSAQAALRQQARRGIARDFGLLEAVAQRAPRWLDKTAPGILGYYLVCCLRWTRVYGEADGQWFDPAAIPAQQVLAGMYEMRPAARAAARAEGLGQTPFSAPAPCHPPEGSPY
ncbi:MAG: glutathione S-transferase family protein [Marinibacterium sp.]